MGQDRAGSPRRGRPPVITRERLLEVAREVFLEHGIRATTAEVALRASVAEGTIFHRFGSKADLFREAMQSEVGRLVPFIDAMPERAGLAEPRAVLLEFAERFLEFAKVGVPVMMMSWSNPEPEPCGRSADRHSKYRRIISNVSQFLEREMELGRLARGDTEVLSRMLIASLHHFCFSEVVLGAPVGRLSAREFAESVVDTLLAAVRSKGTPKKKRASR